MGLNPILWAALPLAGIPELPCCFSFYLLWAFPATDKGYTSMRVLHVCLQASPLPHYVLVAHLLLSVSRWSHACTGGVDPITWAALLLAGIPELLNYFCFIFPMLLVQQMRGVSLHYASGGQLLSRFEVFSSVACQLLFLSRWSHACTGGVDPITWAALLLAGIPELLNYFCFIFPMLLVQQMRGVSLHYASGGQLLSRFQVFSSVACQLLFLSRWSHACTGGVDPITWAALLLAGIPELLNYFCFIFPMLLVQQMRGVSLHYASGGQLLSRFQVFSSVACQLLFLSRWSHACTGGVDPITWAALLLAGIPELLNYFCFIFPMLLVQQMRGVSLHYASGGQLLSRFQVFSSVACQLLSVSRWSHACTGGAGSITWGGPQLAGAP